MRTLADPDAALAQGLADIRRQFTLPTGFTPEVLTAAEQAAARAPTEHRDRTREPFVTLDPAGATDLDQAFSIERSGSDLLLHYAIADVAWFVRDGDPLDQEAWLRGESQYLPDGKVPLYPPAIGEGAASLLPDGPRPAVIFTTRVSPEGEVQLYGVERAVIRSRAKLAYETVREAELPPAFAELAARLEAAEAGRGASRVDPPEQEVARREDGGYALVFRPRLASETRNAALSLANNLAVAELLKAHSTGLFRVMAEPDERAIRRLRQTARAFELDWPDAMSLANFERGLRPHDTREAAFMLAIRRAGRGASYAPFEKGVVPWHSAVAASYVHATAPLRRLADRYVVQAALAVANGKPVPDPVQDAFERLPAVMARADGLAGQISRAVVELAEAVMLRGHEGETFRAVVTDIDERGARVQLCKLPVVTRVTGAAAAPGEALAVRLETVDVGRRVASFSLA